MHSRNSNRTYRTAAAAHAKVIAARQALTDELEPCSGEGEPMRRYPHPIVQPGQAPSQLACSGELSPAMTQILEQLCYQNQLLVDLLAAVNGLAAATLARDGKN